MYILTKTLKKKPQESIKKAKSYDDLHKNI